MDDESVHERLRAVERTLTDGRPVADLADEAALQDRLDAVEDRLDAVEDRLDDAEGATQALRGYVGNVRAVNRDVERRADAAFAAAGADHGRDAPATDPPDAPGDAGQVGARRDGAGDVFAEVGAEAPSAVGERGQGSDRRGPDSRPHGTDPGSDTWPSEGGPSPGTAGHPNPVPDPPARETRSLRERVADWL